MDICWNANPDSLEDENQTSNTLNVRSSDARQNVMMDLQANGSASTQSRPGLDHRFLEEPVNGNLAFLGQRGNSQLVSQPEPRSIQWVTQLELESRLREVSAALESGLSDIRGEIFRMQQDFGPQDRGSLNPGESSTGPFTMLKLEVAQLHTKLSTMRSQINGLQEWKVAAASQPASKDESSCLALEALKAVEDLRLDLQAVRTVASAGNTTVGWAADPQLVPALPPNALDFAVQLDRRGQQGALGVIINADDGSSLRVDGVSPGIVQIWNDMNPGFAVQVGDRILAVNGIAGDAGRMVESATQSERVALTVRRYLSLGSAASI